MFSATEAAFSGFRAAREHFGAILVWVVVFGVIAAGLSAVFFPVFGPVLADLEAFQTQTNPDPQEVLAVFSRLGTALMPLLIASLVVSAVQSAAINRMMLRPRDSAFAYLRLGAAELRQLAVMVLLGLLLSAFYVVLVFAIVLLIGVAAAINPALAVLVGIGGGLAGFFAFLWVGVRLSLAKAQTFDTDRINLFGSWTLTRGRFWPMLGAYLLAFVMLMIVSVAVQAIAMLAVAVFAGGFSAVGQAQSPDYSSLAAFLTPATMISLAFSLVAAPFQTLILHCPAPDIYQSLAGVKGQDAAFA